MSNGLFREVKKIIESGEIPPDVSNSLLMAAVIDNNQRSVKNSDDIKTLQVNDKKWGGAAMIMAFLGAIFKMDN